MGSDLSGFTRYTVKKRTVNIPANREQKANEEQKLKECLKRFWQNNRCLLIVGLLLLIVGGLVYSFCKGTLWTDTPTQYQLNLEYKQTLQESISNEKQTK